MFAQDTLEDPANRIERDGFLDEIERISDASGVFESAQFGKLASFLAERGREIVPDPECVTNAELDAAFEVLGSQTTPVDAHDAPYLELALSNLPAITKPRVEPKKLSTGREPLEIARIGNAWRISCTGCGEASPLVEFRWQVLDQTVACRC